MAPAKGTKRGATQVNQKVVAATTIPTPPQKKPKVNPMIVGVNEAIKMAALPEACQAMLLAGTPGCLLTPADQRHEHQELVVKMLDEVLSSIQIKMRGALDADNAKIEEAGMTKDGHESAVTAAIASLALKAEEVTVKESVLERISKAVLDAKANVAEAQLAQSKGDADLVKAEKDKEMIQEALKENVSALKEEGEWEIAKVQKSLDALLPLAKNLAFDESLITALPTSCMKKPSDRGGFDVMVVNQLEVDLNNRVAALSEALSNGAPASAERAATVVAMQKVLDEASDDHQRAAADLSATQTAHCEATSALKIAEATSAEFLSAYARLIGVRDEKASEMDNFMNYNMLCFTTLRDKIVEKAKPIVEGTEMQATVEPIVEGTEIPEKVEPIVEDAEMQTTVEPIVEGTETPKKVEPIVEDAEMQATVEPIVEDTEISEKVEPIVEGTELMEKVEPIVERTEILEKMEPIVEGTNIQDFALAGV